MNRNTALFKTIQSFQKGIRVINSINNIRQIGVCSNYIEQFRMMNSDSKLMVNRLENLLEEKSDYLKKNNYI